MASAGEASAASLRLRRLIHHDHAPGTVLTLRVTKADADAFAKGEMEFDAFQKKASMQAYTGNGDGLSSVSSWMQSPLRMDPFGR